MALANSRFLKRNEIYQSNAHQIDTFKIQLTQAHRQSLR